MIYANDHKSKSNYVSTNTLLQSKQNRKSHFPTYKQFMKEQEVGNHPQATERPKKEAIIQQESEIKRSIIPVNGLDRKNVGKTARQIYNEWQNNWLSKAGKAHQEEKALREEIRQKDPATYARNYDLFTHGQTNVFGKEYEAIYHLSQNSSTMLDNATAVLDWIEARVASGHDPTIQEINHAVMEIIKGKEILESYIKPIGFGLMAWGQIENRQFNPMGEIRPLEYSQEIGKSNRFIDIRKLNSKPLYRVMTEAELNAVKETGRLRGGWEGETYFTDSYYKNADNAQNRLSLKNKPQYILEFKIINNPKVAGGSRVEPTYGGTGGGREYVTTDPVEVKIINY